MRKRRGRCLLAAAGVAVLALFAATAGAAPPADSHLVTGAVETDRPGGVLPFYSEAIQVQLEQVPVPAGRCTAPPPPGLSYLWLSSATDTATSTHLGRGSHHIELCVFGLLTNPAAAPPDNGIFMGYFVDSQMWTAANGDQLLATGAFLGVAGTPGAPDFRVKESVTFVDVGTGRFQFAEGTAQAIIDPLTGASVVDGWIRYGRNDK